MTMVQKQPLSGVQTMIGNQPGQMIHHTGVTQVWQKTSRRLQQKILLQLHQMIEFEMLMVVHPQLTDPKVVLKNRWVLEKKQDQMKRKNQEYQGKYKAQLQSGKGFQVQNLLPILSLQQLYLVEELHHQVRKRFLVLIKLKFQQLLMYEG